MNICAGEKIGDGDVGTWNAKWQYMSTRPEQCADFTLFTREPPVTPGQQNLRAYWRMLARHIPEGVKASCLEVGAGRGTTSMYLSEAGHAVTLIDAAPSARTIAEMNFRVAGLADPTIVTGDADNMEFADGSFDIVHSVGLLEHFMRPQQVLSELDRVAKAGALNFHVIVQKGNPHVFRNGLEPDVWRGMIGAHAACYRSATSDGVYILHWRKP